MTPVSDSAILTDLELPISEKVRALFCMLQDNTVSKAEWQSVRYEIPRKRGSTNIYFLHPECLQYWMDVYKSCGHEDFEQLRRMKRGAQWLWDTLPNNDEVASFIRNELILVGGGVL